jgi:uncharacterized protein (TIGR02246 family)
MNRAHDEAAVRGLVDAFVNAWNAGDGEALARPFAADADFTAIHGLKARGRDMIARGHSEILATIYKGTRLRAAVESIRFLRADVAVADVTMESEHFPFGIRNTLPLIVATKEDGAWSIAVFRNMVPFERPLAGPLENKLIAKSRKAIEEISMLRRIVKIVGTVALLLVAVAGAGVGYLYLRKPAQAQPSAIRVRRTPERIARGRFIFEVLADCDGCHSQRDFTRVGGPVVPSGRGRGNVLSALVKGLPGTVVAPNITPDPETGIGAWTDGEKIRAIREGVDRNGRALFPMMPYAGFRNMSDDDVESLVAYLDTLPSICYPLPATTLDFPVGLMIKSEPRPASGVAQPNHADRVQYGEYLVTVAGCGHCHTPTDRGQPVPGKLFAGGQVFATAMGTVVSANLTPDNETGIGRWSARYFLQKFEDYRDYATAGPPKLAGPDAFTLMPWLSLSRLPAEDLDAIYAYLRTVKPVSNAVDTHPEAAALSTPLHKLTDISFGEVSLRNWASESDRVRRTDYSIESLQMASLSWRHHPLVRAVVLEVPDLVYPHG